jgi:hypothetical protein
MARPFQRDLRDRGHRATFGARKLDAFVFSGIQD